MLRRHALLALLAIAAAPLAHPTAAGAQQVDTLSIRGHTRFLASDQLLGRGTGTQGERLAAAYIISQLERLGLRPAGDSFRQPLPLQRAVIDPASSLSLARTTTTTFDHYDDFVVNTGGQGAFRDFRGRPVFFGQPVHAAPLVAGQRSMVGRIAVFEGPLGANALDIIPALSHAGAAGVILLIHDSTQFQLYQRSRGDSRYFVDAPVDDPIWQPSLPVILAGPALSAALLAGSEVPPAIMQGTATEPVELAGNVSVRISARMETVPSANVAAVLPGSDPELRDEYVVYTAHYDHLGISTPDARGDSIYNGFSDNAAGVSMLLAIAEAMRDEPPARSVAFLFFSGEERGLLGSTYMAAYPPFALEQVVALINLDAGAPPAPALNWRLAGGSGSTLGELARDVAAEQGWTANLAAASPNSDYWPFLQQGVPSIFVIPGDQWENVTPDERDALRRRWDRYHAADDHWEADFPFAGLGRYADYALRIGLRAAGR